MDDDEILRRWITSRAIFDENHISSTPPERRRFVESTGQTGTIGCLRKKNEKTRLRVSLSYVFQFTLQSAAKVSPIIFSRTLFRRHQVPPTIPTDVHVHRLSAYQNFLFCYVSKGKSPQKFPKCFLRTMKSSSTVITKKQYLFIFIEEKYSAVINCRWMFRSRYWRKFYRRLLCNFSFSPWDGEKRLKKGSESFFKTCTREREKIDPEAFIMYTFHVCREERISASPSLFSNMSF